MLNKSVGATVSRHKLFGERFTPIYVYTPKYVDWSAGIRALHYLCHSLNQNGFHAWVAIHGPQHKNESLINPLLDTPILTKRISRIHREAGLTSIGVYPETVGKNPLNSSVTVRWILNLPGLLGGERVHEDDFVIAYSKYIAEVYEQETKESIPVLFLPVVNVDELDKVKATKGEGGNDYRLLYCQKFRALGGAPGDHGANVVEIKRFGRKAQARSETLRLLANAHELIAYENSTIISEAQYLGVPVICVANEWFHHLIAEAELGSDGVSWDTPIISPDSNSTTLRFEGRLEKAISEFHLQLGKLAWEWSAKSSTRTPRTITLPRNSFLSVHSLYRAKAVIRSSGIRGFANFGWSYIRRSARGHGL